VLGAGLSALNTEWIDKISTNEITKMNILFAISAFRPNQFKQIRTSYRTLQLIIACILVEMDAAFYMVLDELLMWPTARILVVTFIYFVKIKKKKKNYFM
jgi:hypothetical protein